MRRCLLACCLLGPASSDVGREIPHRTCYPVGYFYTRTTTQRGEPTADAQQAGQARATRAARAASGADCHTARFDRERESQRGTAEPGEDTSQSGRGQPGKRNATANIKAPPNGQSENWAGVPAQAGTPAVISPAARTPAGKAADVAGRLAGLHGACLGLAGRRSGRQSRPQAAFPCAPPRAKRGEGGACAASARGGLNCGPPQRREPNDRRKPGES